MALQMSVEELMQFLDREFPQVTGEFSIEDLGEMQIRVRLNVGERHLRPGGTVSGPAMFGLADVSVYLAVLAMIGPVGLAVTTNCSIDFMGFLFRVSGNHYLYFLRSLFLLFRIVHKLIITHLTNNIPCRIF